MQGDPCLSFDRYRLDLPNEQVWSGHQAIPLTSKAFAVLRYLVEHAGQLVTKAELFAALWPGTAVSDGALTVCIVELRKALGDAAKAPRFIETVHRRGYRFIGPLGPFPDQSPVHRETSSPKPGGVRKLAAILSADVYGYSRLMGQDEVGTIRTLTTSRAVMTGLIGQYRGRVVNAPGDNVLAEFASAVDAVQCAVAIQCALGAKNADLPVERQMAFRIGLNVGDVVVEGAEIYGDGVNIAARLEALAEPGGLCISGTVYDQVKAKVALRYEPRGERRVKNIAEPVRVYRVRWEPEDPAAPVSAPPAQQDSSEPQSTARPSSARRSQLPQRASLVVGREAELAQLRGYWEQAQSGERQLVFVTGEPGIGKTTLVEAFLEQLEEQALWLGQGQCIEQYGAGEAYMSILQALGRLCREAGGAQLIALLHQHAPTWLVQMPALLRPDDLEALQRKVLGATRERMLREMGDAIDVITAEHPLVLVLEDLHWSDASTLELLALLARRREPARLLVVGTYRPVDIIVTEHPLRAVKQELHLHGLCEELALKFLTEAAVEAYVAGRFAADRRVPDAAPLPQLAHTIYQRTEGNPLFMVNVVEELLTQGAVTSAAVEVSTPATIRQLIERHLERLSVEEKRVLEVASIAGMEFSAAAVAAGAEAAVEDVEECYTKLVRHGHFLWAKGTEEWPDGTVATRYGFLHALYQAVIYERVPAGRRARLHQRIGERTEIAYGKRAREIAAELAMHFEQSKDYQRAVQYLRQAGENAVRRSAYPEAITLLTKGVEILKTLPDTPEHAQQELLLLRGLGPALISLKGFVTPEVEQTYGRLYELCQQGGNPQELIYVLQGLQIFHLVRGEVGRARDLAEQGWRVAQRISTPTALMTGHAFLIGPFYCLGELSTAHEHVEQAWRLYNPQEHNRHVLQHWVDPGVVLLMYLALTSLSLGYPDQAQQRFAEGFALAERQSHAFSLAFALSYECSFFAFRREWQLVRERAEEMMRLSTEYGFPDRLAHGTALRGRALVELGQVDEGIVQIEQGLAFFGGTGAELARIGHLPWLAAAYAKVERVEDGLAVLAEALTVVDNTEIRVDEAELYRLKGQLVLQAAVWGRGKSEVQSSVSKVRSPKSPNPQSQAQAESCFLKAIDIAQRQQAKIYELRAATSLARLWQSQGKREEAHKLLADIYGWFTEGFDTKDLEEAKALLEALST